MTPESENAARRGQSSCGAQTQAILSSEEYHGAEPDATSDPLQIQVENLVRDVSYAGLRAGGVEEATRRCLALRVEVDLALQSLGVMADCLDGKLVAL